MHHCGYLRAARALLLSVSLAALAACGGGGGGGGGGTGAVAPSPTPPAPTPIGPSTSSAEYLRSWGVAGVKAEAAWNLGHGGQGVTVAVIDDGVDGSTPDLSGRLSSASTDINAARNQLVGTERHGTQIAGIIAANNNGQGTVGVAFNSTILSIRADNANGNFNSSDLARAIDYAVSHGAKVINLSLGTNLGPGGTAFEDALKRATDAGVIFTMAAGNEASTAAHWPSGYAVDPRYAGSIIAVGSLNQSGQISSFSNPAAGTANLYLVAPGEAVVTDCNGTTCWQVSGTSFAAPHVAGGMALVLQAFPNMSGKAALDLLLRTARDLGAPGTDAVYGRGALDLARAFAPVGSLSVPTETGLVSANTGTPTQMGAAFGDAVQTSAALHTVGWDFYDRPFGANLALTYGAARPSIISAIPALSHHRSQVEAQLSGGGRLALSAGLVDTPVASPADRFPWMPAENSRDVTVAYRSGRLALTAWSGAAVGNPFTVDNHDPFTALAQSDHALRADYLAGRWLMSAEFGGGERRSPDLLRQQDGARYARATGRTVVRGVPTAITIGQLIEPMGPLGAYLPVQTGMNLPSRTSFASWSAEWPLSDRFTLSTEASLGRTDLNGRFMALEEAAWSTSWRASLSGPCAAFGLGCTELRFSLAQPLRIEGGRFIARLPDMPSTYFGPVSISERRFDASPSGRQMDFTVTATKQTSLGALQLDAVASSQAGHRRSSEPAYGLLTTWRSGF